MRTTAGIDTSIARTTGLVRTPPGGRSFAATGSVVAIARKVTAKSAMNERRSGARPVWFRSGRRGTAERIEHNSFVRAVRYPGSNIVCALDQQHGDILMTAGRHRGTASGTHRWRTPSELLE